MKRFLIFIGLLLLVGYVSADINSYQSNLVFLAHMNGTSGGVIFTEEFGRTFTVNGNTNTDTTVKQFGTASGHFDGSGDYLSWTENSTPTTNISDLGTGNFTMHALVNLTNTGHYGGILSSFDVGSYGYQIAITNSQQISINSNAGDISITSASALSPGVWYSADLIRAGTTLTLYINGVSNGTDTSSQNFPKNIGTPIVIGRYYSNSNQHYTNGYIDELAVWKGVAIPISDLYPQGSEISAEPPPIPPPAPIPSFTSNVTGGTEPLSVQFNDTSITSITNWSWNFGEGNTSTIQNATNIFYNGNHYVTLNVTNASGSSSTPAAAWINVSDSGGLSGWNRQDIMMDQIYTLTLNIKDASSLSGIPGATIATSNGDNTTTSILGVATITTNYTALVVQVGASGYLSRSISYVVDRDRTETIYLTAISQVSNGTPLTYYSPWQVRFRIVDFNGNPLPGTNVTANYMASTLPSTSTSWLINAFGINSDVAGEMVNSGVAMAGRTDSNGGLSFTMFKSIQYALLITNTSAGLSATKNIYPSDQEYLIRVPLPGQSPVNNTLASMASTSLPVYQLNATAYNLSVIYRDTSGLTDKVLFIVKYRNGTVLLNEDLGNPGTGTVVGNYTVNNIGIGTEILWSYNARRAGT